MKPFLNLVLIFIFSIGYGNSQNSNEKINIGEKVILKSKMYNEDRTLSIYLPASYNEGNNKYPVLYRLDGEFTFVQTVGNIARLVYFDELAPETILVSIHNTDRNRDMLPSISQYAPEGGSNEKFMLFLKDELIPFINKNYRTSDYKILCGQSFSGLFTVFTFLKQPELFNAYIAISPSSADCKLYLQELANNSSMTDERRNTKVHLSRGGDDGEIAVGFSASHILDIVLDKGKDRNDKFPCKFDVFENEGHVPRSAFYEGLKWIFENIE